MPSTLLRYSRLLSCRVQCRTREGTMPKRFNKQAVYVKETCSWMRSAMKTRPNFEYRAEFLVSVLTPRCGVHVLSVVIYLIR